MWNAATPFDEHGFCNYSYGTNNCNIYRQTSKKQVIEVRSDYPWAEGGRFNTINIDGKWPQINEKAIKAEPEREALKHGLPPKFPVKMMPVDGTKREGITSCRSTMRFGDTIGILTRTVNDIYKY